MIVPSRARRRERLARHDRHRVQQPRQVVGIGERPEPPSARAAPLAQSRADDRPFGIELGDGHVGAPVVNLSVDFVRQDDDTVASRHLADLAQLVRVVRMAGRVVRIVQHDDARASRIGFAQPLQILRLQLPVVRARRLDPAHVAPDDPRLRRIRHPRWRRDDQIAVVDQLQQEHQLFRARSDQHVLGVPVDTVATAVIFRDGRTQRFEPSDRTGRYSLRCALSRSAWTTGSGTGNGDWPRPSR